MNIALRIIGNMPKDLNNLEKARYLYLELCKMVSFSTQLQNTDDENFDKLYTRKVDVNSFDEKQVNCRMWSQLYSQLLDLVSIENKIIDNGHQHVLFKYNGKLWIADATYGTYTDLSRVKNYDETIGFGLGFYQNSDKYSNALLLDDEVRTIINDIDQKLGYNTNHKQKLLEFKDYLAKIRDGNIKIEDLISDCEVTDENRVSLKLEYLFSTVGELNAGYYEQKDFICNLEKLILNYDELQTIGSVELKKTNFDKSVDIVQCIYVKCGDYYNYYLLAPNMCVSKYEPEQIVNLGMAGYGIEKKEIPGIIFPKKFIPGKVSVDFKYKLKKYYTPLVDKLEKVNNINR